MTVVCYLCNDLRFIAPHRKASIIFGRGNPVHIAHEARPPDHHHPVIPCPACALRTYVKQLDATLKTHEQEYQTGAVLQDLRSNIPPLPEDPILTVIPKAGDDVDRERTAPEDWSNFTLHDDPALASYVRTMVEQYILALLRSRILTQVEFHSPGGRLGGCGPRGDCRDCPFELWENTQVNSEPRIGFVCACNCHLNPKETIGFLRELIESHNF